MTNGSKFMIYLTFLNFLLLYLQEYSKIWKLAYVKAPNILFPCNFSQFLNFTDDCKGPNNIYLNGACYYVETTKLGFSEAIANCQETLYNGRLFEPRDETTHNSVHAAAVAISSQDYWLGINDTLSEGQFQYISGGNLTFSNWEEGMHIRHIRQYNLICIPIVLPLSNTEN